jgi:hypothetical protein
MSKSETPIMAIRVDPYLKNNFIEVAKLNDRTGSQLLRDFMRDYIKKNNQQKLPL